jgi:homoserine O-succinyltransferase
MSVILPNNYHARPTLENRGIICLSEDEANRADIRPLRIGILNIMPKGETYEPYLLFPLSRSIIQIEPIWIRLHTHVYKTTDSLHLDLHYDYFEDVIAEGPVDGLVITGAPVEEIPYEDVTYWNEIVTILTFARHNITSTLGICWGGLALAKMIGIEKEMFPHKLFGVFETHNINRSHPVTGELDDILVRAEQALGYFGWRTRDGKGTQECEFARSFREWWLYDIREQRSSLPNAPRPSRV